MPRYLLVKEFDGGNEMVTTWSHTEKDGLGVLAIDMQNAELGSKWEVELIEMSKEDFEQLGERNA